MSCYETLQILVDIFFGASSLLVAIVSIVIAIKSLKQSNQMLEEESRPYIVVYGFSANFGTPRYTIAIKNFGKTAAVIEEFIPSIDLKQIAFDKEEKRIPFDNITGMTIVPNFSIIRDVEWNGNPNTIQFHVKYTSSGKTYEEDFKLKYDIELNDPHGKDKSPETMKNISYAIQEYVKRCI